MDLILLLLAGVLCFALTGFLVYLPIGWIEGFHIPLWLIGVGLVILVSWLIGD